MVSDESWRLRQGDAITPELTAMRLLGGGSAYEAYLAFDDVTLSPVVVKMVRPDQTTDRDHRSGRRHQPGREVTVMEKIEIRKLDKVETTTLSMDGA